MIERSEVLELVGPATPLGLTIAHADDRYDLLRGLRQLVGDARIAATAPEPAAWAELCREAKLLVESAAERVGRRDAEVEERGTYMATVLTAHWAAMRRLGRPGMSVVEVRCRGEMRRVSLGKRTAHGARCSCLLLDETVAVLDGASAGLQPWGRYAGAALIWLGMRGLVGMHVIRLRHGVPTALEDSVPVDPVTGDRYRFEWGYRGARPSRLAQAVLADAMDRELADVSPELADRFVMDVVITMHGGQGFVLYQSRVDEWLANYGSGRQSIV